MSQTEMDDAQWMNPDNWYLDILSFSRRDSRPFVPKRGCDEMAGAEVGRPRGGARRLPVSGFPYDVVYRARGAAVEVLAVLYHHRRPGYWRGRRRG